MYGIRIYATRGSELFNNVMDLWYFGITRERYGHYNNRIHTDAKDGIIRISIESDNNEIIKDFESIQKRFAA